MSVDLQESNTISSLKSKLQKKNYMSNVLSKDHMDALVSAILQLSSNVLSKSLGPYGSTTMIDTRDGMIATKDGATIYKYLSTNDAMANRIIAIIREISDNIITEVGDGSTTAIVAANELYLSVFRLQKKFPELSTREIMEKLTYVSEIIVNELKDNTIHLSDDLHELEDIATVSTNNNKTLGKLICEIYQKCGKNAFIFPKLSPNRETTYDISNGFKIYKGFLDPAMINTEDNKCHLDNVRVVLFDGVINFENLKVLHKILYESTDSKEQKGTPVLVMAPDFSPEVRGALQQFFLTLHQSHQLSKVNIVQFDLSTDLQRAQYEDIAYLTHARVIPISSNPDLDDIIANLDKYIGHAINITSNKKETIIINSGDVDCSLRLKQIEHDMETERNDNILTDVKAFEYEKRLATLSNSLATIYVGGESLTDKQANKDLVDDAILACRSTLEHGYCAGSSLTIPKIIESIKDESLCICDEHGTIISSERKYDEYNTVILEMIKDVYYRVFKKIFQNKGPAITEDIVREKFDVVTTCDYMEYTIDNITCLEFSNFGYNIITDEFTTKVINSTNTEIQILKYALSIVSYLVLSNQMITTNPEERIMVDMDGVMTIEARSWED